MNNATRRFRSAQMILANWPQQRMSELKKMLRKWPFGGFVFHSHDIVSPAWLRETTEELWSFYSRQGWPAPWFAVTEEGGTVQRFRQWFDVPSAMSLGNLATQGMSYEAGFLVGKFLLSCGINWNFAPVVDVATERRSRVIGTRSFGSTPEMVAEHATAWLLGQQGAGVMSTAKHFPGHGMTTQDSHMERPLTQLDRDDFKTHLDPFRKAIDAGVQSIMTAHISYSKFDDRPATLSPFWLKTVLRDELGFQGLVVTDALSMKAIAQHVDPIKAATEAILAGADVIDCGGTFDQAVGMCEFLFDEIQTLAVRERLKESEPRILASKGSMPKPSEWPCAPDRQAFMGIENQLANRLQDKIRLTGDLFKTHPIEVWVSGSAPTEVQEESDDHSDMVWLNTRDPATMKIQLVDLQTHAKDQLLVLFTENLWKHPEVAQEIEKYLGDSIGVLVAVLDPVDAELFPHVQICVPGYGNRHVARKVAHAILPQQQSL